MITFQYYAWYLNLVFDECAISWITRQLFQIAVLLYLHFIA